MSLSLCVKEIPGTQIFSSDIHTLSNKDRESFLEFCKKASSPIQIYLFSRFLGFQGTVVECNEWSTKEFKKRNFNVVLESEIDNMQIDINKLRDAIDMGIVKQDMGAARIAMLQKELRGAIKQIEDKTFMPMELAMVIPPAEIHSFTALEDDTYILTIVGGNYATNRHYYNVEENTYVVAKAGAVKPKKAA